MRNVLATCMLALLAGPAFSAGWTVDDLGSMAERADCMNKAEATVKKYFETHGGSNDYGRSEWSLGAYGLRGDVIDALIICPIEAGMVEPFLIVHNSDSNNDARKIVTTRLKEIWEAQP